MYQYYNIERAEGADIIAAIFIAVMADITGSRDMGLLPDT